MAQFAEFVFELARRLAEVAPDPAEMLLMEAVIAFSERPGLLDARIIEETQEIYMEALQQYIDVKRPRNSTLIHRYLSILSDLRRFCLEHVESPISSNSDYDSFLDVKPEKAMLEQIMQQSGQQYSAYHITR
ncbi:hypothetical protein ANCCAN_11235 [Ancylostoma caninum]|uniref:NR LBD domain-containing protein n=1 Tax=Ancylostoma caninum TaxID=29170 RepID=A0A368GEL0_ANCCA|nr:hypothetical protein ANCCAN_11235 [Ancylostoma caninum]